MSKQYQTTDVQASMSSVLGLAMPEQVTVALARSPSRLRKACWRWPWAQGCR